MSSRRERHVLFGHLVLVALALPAMIWVCSIPTPSMAILGALVFGVLYLVYILAWTTAGSRYGSYLILLGLGWSPISLLSLWSTFILLANKGVAGYVVPALMLAYLAHIAGRGLLRAWQWLGAPPPDMQKRLDRERGTYNLSAHLTLFGDSGQGDGRSSPVGKIRSRWWIGVIYILPLLIVTSLAWTLLARTGLSLSDRLGILAWYVFSMLTSAAALSYWQQLHWVRLWERDLERPVLVRQLAYRYRPKKFWSARRGLGAGMLLLVLGSLWLLSSPPGPYNRGENGLWLGIEWTQQPSSAAEVEALAALLQKHQVRYLYVYTTYFTQEGQPRHKITAEAAAFVRQIKRAYPESVVLAWVGIPLPAIDLESPLDRAQVVELCGQLVRESGFDGLHLDAEPVQDGSAGFLRLLEEVRVDGGPETTLSIAGEPWRPQTHWIRLPYLDSGNKWSGAYYREVAKRVDQIAVMTYGSGLPMEGLYEIWLWAQVAQVAQSVRGIEVDLVFGVPSYKEPSPAHDPRAEHLESGLNGVRRGISWLPASLRENVHGVAPYAAWEMGEQEWAIFRQQWLEE